MSLNSGLKIWYPCDARDINGTTLYDRSGNGLNGTLVNGPTQVPGKVGGGLQFVASSSQYVDFSEISFGGTSAWAWAGWVKFDASTSGLIASSQTKLNRITRTTDTNIRIITDAGVARDFTTASTGSTVFRHIVVVHEAGGNLRVYVDGTASASNPISDTGAMGFGRLAATSVPNAHFDGKMDDVRFYNRDLSAAEVTALYQWRGISAFNSPIFNFPTLLRGI